MEFIFDWLSGDQPSLQNIYLPYLPAYKSHWSISRTRLKIRLEP